MAAPKGNRFWEARSKHGRDKIFANEEILWEAACEYFEWVENNPLMSSELVKFQGEASIAEVPKMRAMTLDGLYLFLDISRTTWDLYRGREDYVAVITRIESTIRDQKFSGAAADLLNANIIARDLGLSDKKEVDNKHSFENMTDDELDNAISSLSQEVDD